MSDEYEKELNEENERLAKEQDEFMDYLKSIPDIYHDLWVHLPDALLEPLSFDVFNSDEVQRQLPIAEATLKNKPLNSHLCIDNSEWSWMKLHAPNYYDPQFGIVVPVYVKNHIDIQAFINQANKKESALANQSSSAMNDFLTFVEMKTNEMRYSLTKKKLSMPNEKELDSIKSNIDALHKKLKALQESGKEILNVDKKFIGELSYVSYGINLQKEQQEIVANLDITLPELILLWRIQDKFQECFPDLNSAYVKNSPISALAGALLNKKDFGSKKPKDGSLGAIDKRIKMLPEKKTWYRGFDY